MPFLLQGNSYPQKFKGVVGAIFCRTRYLAGKGSKIMTPNFSLQSRTSESFGIVADWTQALIAKGDLGEVLERVMQLLKADAAVISRLSTEGNTTRYVERCYVQTGKVWSTPPRSYVKTVIGENLPTAIRGSIWKLSDRRSCDYTKVPSVDSEFPEQLMEIIMSPMEVHKGHADIFELHYCHRPTQHDLDFAIMLIGTLSSGWHRRVSGFVVKRLTQNRKYICLNNNDQDDIPILDVENPAGLSRCEFRICSLLQEGMTVNVIAKTLSIAPVTVRTHLSSAFSKTGTCNQVGLLYELNRNKLPTASEHNGLNRSDNFQKRLA